MKKAGKPIGGSYMDYLGDSPAPFFRILKMLCLCLFQCIGGEGGEAGGRVEAY